MLMSMDKCMLRLGAFISDIAVETIVQSITEAQIGTTTGDKDRSDKLVWRLRRRSLYAGER